jgi:cytochrome c
MPIRSLPVLLLLWLLPAAPVSAASPASHDAGRRIAAQNCGECHATTGTGASPLKDAPPFRLLYKRYCPGDLDRLLSEGMLAPQDPQDEAPAIFHPRMPRVKLDADEAAALRGYLLSFDPRRSPVGRGARAGSPGSGKCPG